MEVILLALITALSLAYLCIPSVIKIAEARQLMVTPEMRSSHTTVTPAMGGIGIFIGSIFSMVLWTPFSVFGDLQYLLCAIIIMFFVGLRDDLLAITPIQKLIGQLIAGVLLIMKSDVVIRSFHGVLGIGELPDWLAIGITLFAIVLIVNAFNLIDGINGLCASITILTCAVMGTWFFLTQEMALAITAAATAGGTMGFMKYNVRGDIFMGDTGSLLVGVVAAVLFIEFIQMNAELTFDHPHRLEAGVAVATSVLIYPLLDTVRVFIVRALRGRSPFSPDRHHLHHYLLDTGRSHLGSTAIIVLGNIGIIYMTWKLQFLGNTVLILIQILLGIIISSLLFLLRRNKLRAKAVQS